MHYISIVTDHVNIILQQERSKSSLVVLTSLITITTLTRSTWNMDTSILWTHSSGPNSVCFRGPSLHYLEISKHLGNMLFQTVGFRQYSTVWIWSISPQWVSEVSEKVWMWDMKQGPLDLKHVTAWPALDIYILDAAAIHIQELSICTHTNRPYNITLMMPNWKCVLSIGRWTV